MECKFGPVPSTVMDWIHDCHDQFGEFSQRLPAGMTFNLNAQSSLSNFAVGSSVVVSEGMADLVL